MASLWDEAARGLGGPAIVECLIDLHRTGRLERVLASTVREPDDPRGVPS